MHKWSDEETDKLKELLNRGIPPIEIGKLLGITANAVRSKKSKILKQKSEYEKIKKCQFCGKEFHSRTRKKYCSDECLKSAFTGNRNTQKEQLCWTCKKATGGCSWSRYFKPIDVWDAIPTIILSCKNEGNREIQSFSISKCPEFQEES